MTINQLTEAYDKGYEDGRRQAADYVLAQVGKERLCPSRARLIDWNRAMTRLSNEIKDEDTDECCHPIDAIYWNEWNNNHQCHRCGRVMRCHPNRGWVEA